MSCSSRIGNQDHSVLLPHNVAFSPLFCSFTTCALASLGDLKMVFGWFRDIALSLGEYVMQLPQINIRVRLS